MRAVAKEIVSRLWKHRVQIVVSDSRMAFWVPTPGNFGRPEAKSCEELMHQEGAIRELANLVRSVPGLGDAVREAAEERA